MKARHFAQIVLALQKLGCRVVIETADSTMMCRGAAKLTNVPRDELVPVLVQRHVLRVFDIDEEEFLRALFAVN